MREQAALLDAATDSIVALDMHDRVRYWNAAAGQVYGWTAAESLGRPLKELLAEGSGLDRAEAELNSRGEWDGELTRLTKEGRLVVEFCRWTLVRHANGEPKSKLLIATDITERKRLEEQLRQAQRMEGVGRLAGGIAHDFNNMLTVMMGYAECLLDESRLDPRVREAIVEIHRAGERASRLTRQLLAFGRKQILRPCVLQLNDLVREMSEMLRRLLGERIDLHCELASDLECIEADVGQLEQVLLNLAVNARDAMKSEGRLELRTRNIELTADQVTGAAAGCYIELSVADTGCGMDEATLKSIFEPYFTTKEPGHGTGFGLATVVGIVEQSHGRIAVESVPDQGSVFRLYFPKVSRIAASAPKGASTCPLPRAAATLLICEDDPAARTLMEIILEARGHQVLTASDGEQALEVSAQFPGEIDLLITDVVLPRLGGRQLADQMALLRPETRVLFVSGYVFDDLVQDGSMLRECNFLAKPLTPSLLAQQVESMLASRMCLESSQRFVAAQETRENAHVAG